MKKAQGISMNVIIIAAIALLVLVVLSVVYIGKMGTWGKTTNSCTSNGGKCRARLETCGAEGSNVEDYSTSYPIWDCPDDDSTEKLCCIAVGAKKPADMVGDVRTSGLPDTRNA